MSASRFLLPIVYPKGVHNRSQITVSNHQHHGCLLNCLFRWEKTTKLRVTGLCVGNSPVTGEIPAQMAGNAEMFLFDDVIMCD